MNVCTVRLDLTQRSCDSTPADLVVPLNILGISSPSLCSINKKRTTVRGRHVVSNYCPIWLRERYSPLPVRAGILHLCFSHRHHLESSSFVDRSPCKQFRSVQNWVTLRYGQASRSIANNVSMFAYRHPDGGSKLALRLVKRVFFKKKFHS